MKHPESIILSVGSLGTCRIRGLQDKHIMIKILELGGAFRAVFGPELLVNELLFMDIALM